MSAGEVATAESVAAIEAAAWDALGQVRDPELDEAITELGFVKSLCLEEGRLSIRLRLPTYFCAANFAYMMVLAAREALAGVAGGREVEVCLEDHYAAEEINAGVGAGGSFRAAFPTEATDDLEELRVTFAKKAYLAALERTAGALVELGYRLETLPDLCLADLPASAGLARLLRCREALGISSDGPAPLLVDPDGVAVRVEVLSVWLRRARAVRVSIDANAELCRGLLRTRYLMDELADRSGPGS